MKARKLYVLAACMLGSCIAGNTFAQTAVKQAALFSTAPNSTKENDIIKEENNVKVNFKVQEGFTRNFSEATLKSWSIAGKNYVSNFDVEGVKAIAMFSKTGRLIYTVKYGTEEQLPANLKKLVKANYPGHNISMASQVEENNRNIWVIQLQNNAEVVTARIENDELEQVEKFYKSK